MNILSSIGMPKSGLEQDEKENKVDFWGHLGGFANGLCFGMWAIEKNEVTWYRIIRKYALPLVYAVGLVWGKF